MDKFPHSLAALVLAGALFLMVPLAGAQTFFDPGDVISADVPGGLRANDPGAVVDPTLTINNGATVESNFAVDFIGFPYILNNTDGAVITSSASFGEGVSMAGGNSVVNNSNGATISGDGDFGVGVFMLGGNNVVNNSGGAAISADGESGKGINMRGGNNVVNNSGGAAISAGGNGTAINMRDGNSVVNNSGALTTISADGPGAFGVSMTGENYVVNNSDGATISADGPGGAGVFMLGGNNVVNNSGGATISADGDNGKGIKFFLDGGNNVVNNSGGATISASGSNGIGVDGSNDNDTVNNINAAIIGTLAAIDTGTGDDTINLMNGSVIIGNIDGGDDTDTVNLTGSATFSDRFLGIEFLNMDGVDWDLDGAVAHDVDDTTINSGILRINNGSLSGDVVVNSGGTLSGHLGTVLGTVSGDGTVAPGNSIGVMTFGDYEPGAGGNLEIEFSAADNDVLEVTGTSTLAGTVTFVPLSPGLPGGTFTFIDDLNDNPMVVNRFDTEAIPILFTGSVLYDDPANGDVSVTLTRAFTFTDFADTRNRRAIAGALDRGLDGADGDGRTLLLEMERLTSLEEYRAALDQLSPETLASLIRLKFHESRYFTETLIRRLWESRYEEIFKTYGQGIELAMLGDLDPVFLGRVMNDTSVGARTGWRAFFRGYGLVSQLNSKEDHFGFDSRMAGVALGIDGWVTPRIAVGLALGFSNTDAYFDNDQANGRIRTDHIAVYGEYSGKRCYGDAVFSYGHSKFDMERRIIFGDVNRLAQSQHGGDELLTHAGAGCDWQIGDWLVGPVGSFQYSALFEEGYKEEDAMAANMIIRKNTSHSLRSTLGVRAARSIKKGRTTFIPEGHIRWAHEWLNDPHQISAEFTGIPGGAFDIVDRPLPDASLYAGFAVTAFRGNFAINASYDMDVGRSDFTNHVFNIGLNISF